MQTPFITLSPDIQSGVPVFAGTRVPVKNLFDYLMGGDSIKDFLEDFPSVSREQAEGVLQWAAYFFTFGNYENPPRREPTS